MPCVRCGARQGDAGEQVLVCPTCQQQHDWMADLDHCGACGSAALVVTLGDVRCRDCGEVVPVSPRGETSTSGSATGLADDVAAALARRFGGA